MLCLAKLALVTDKSPILSQQFESLFFFPFRKYFDAEAKVHPIYSRVRNKVESEGNDKIGLVKLGIVFLATGCSHLKVYFRFQSINAKFY